MRNPRVSVLVLGAVAFLAAAGVAAAQGPEGKYFRENGNGVYDELNFYAPDSNGSYPFMLRPGWGDIHGADDTEGGANSDGTMSITVRGALDSNWGENVTVTSVSWSFDGGANPDWTDDVMTLTFTLSDGTTHSIKYYKSNPQ